MTAKPPVDLPLDLPVPCWRCETNAWTDCKHRKGRPEPVRPTVDHDGRSRDAGQGANFRSRKLLNRRIAS